MSGRCHPFNKYLLIYEIFLYFSENDSAASAFKVNGEEERRAQVYINEIHYLVDSSLCK